MNRLGATKARPLRIAIYCFLLISVVFCETGHASSLLYEIVDGPQGEWLYRDGLAVGPVGLDQVNLSSLAWYESRGVLLSTKVNGTYALVSIDPLTGIGTLGASFTASSGIHGLEFNPVTGILYGVDTTRLYTIDPETAAISLDITLSGLTGAQGLTFDGSGNAFVYDSDLKGLFSVDISTGQTTLISNPTQYIRGLAWNPDTDQIYLSPFDGATFVPSTMPVPESSSLIFLISGLAAAGMLRASVWQRVMLRSSQ